MNALIKCASLAVILSGAGVVAAASNIAAANSAQAIDGRWSARLVHGDLVIPFRLDISGSGPTLRGTLYDGFQPYDGTTSATFENGKLVLNIQHYLTTITATLQDGRLTGNVQSVGMGASTQYGFEAARYVAPAHDRDGRAIDCGLLDHSARDAVLKGRESVSVHRVAAGSGGRRFDPASRWRHRRVQWHLPGWKMGAQPLRRLAAGCNRSHPGEGWHAADTAA